MTLVLVCSICGSGNWRGPLQRSVDKRWPMARCMDHTQKGSPWTPLISSESFRKRPRHTSAAPIDIFGSLSPEDQARLKQPIKLR